MSSPPAAGDKLSSSPRQKSSSASAGDSPPAATVAAAANTATADIRDDEFIEPATDPGEEDEFIEEPNDGTTSVSTSVYAHTYEHGRRYHVFKNGRYPVPDDDLEQGREDMKHAMLMELTDGKLFYAPVENPQSVLDIGTGTGIWAIEVGDAYPGAKVTGIDVTPIQPPWVPPNVEFIVDDAEQDLLVRDVDLVHFRYMSAVLKDVPKVLGNAYKALKPGGWIELQELHGDVYCDDGTMPSGDGSSPDSKEDDLKSLYRILHDAFAQFGMDSQLPANLEPLLRDAGFDNIRCQRFKVPIGPWARDKTLRLVGMYQKTAVLNFIPTLAGRPFLALGMELSEAHVRVAMARKAIEDPNVHRYFNYYYWYAQKPESAGPGDDDDGE